MHDDDLKPYCTVAKADIQANHDMNDMPYNNVDDDVTVFGTNDF
jgi:hypothetical protein